MSQYFFRKIESTVSVPACRFSRWYEMMIFSDTELPLSRIMGVLDTKGDWELSCNLELWQMTPFFIMGSRFFILLFFDI